MRVIAGIAKGRQLKMPKGGKTRPAMDRVKSSLFSILTPRILESRFLDLFAGSGSLGIEALSRGAAFAAFVDDSQECASAIKENLALVKMPEKARVFKMDCLTFLKNISLEPFDIVCIDPPYLKGLLDPILREIPHCGMFNEKTLFIIERQKKDELALEQKPEFEFIDERRFGDTVLSFFKLHLSCSSIVP